MAECIDCGFHRQSYPTYVVQWQKDKGYLCAYTLICMPYPDRLMCEQFFADIFLHWGSRVKGCSYVSFCVYICACWWKRKYQLTNWLTDWLLFYKHCKILRRTSKSRSCTGRLSAVIYSYDSIFHRIPAQ